MGHQRLAPPAAFARLDPWIGQKFLDAVSLFRVDGQKVGNQILGSGRDVVANRRRVRVVANCSIDGIGERRKAAEDGIQYAADGPHIDLLVVAAFRDLVGFGRGV